MFNQLFSNLKIQLGFIFTSVLASILTYLEQSKGIFSLLILYVSGATTLLIFLHWLRKNGIVFIDEIKKVILKMRLIIKNILKRLKNKQKDLNT